METAANGQSGRVFAQRTTAAMLARRRPVSHGRAGRAGSSGVNTLRPQAAPPRASLYTRHVTGRAATSAASPAEELVRACGSETDRGLKATVCSWRATCRRTAAAQSLSTSPQQLRSQAEDAKRVRRLAEQLESQQAQQDRLRGTGGTSGRTDPSLDGLSGTWRLLHTSAFLGGNLGGSRPGPTADIAPFRLVRV